MSKKIIFISIVIVLLVLSAGIYLIINKKTKMPNCDALPEKLDSCEKFACEIEHPFSGEMVKREIVGLKNSKCEYKEEMPNGGEMNCQYPLELRKAVAQYYRDIAKAESQEVNITFSSEGQNITYLINSKQVENPLQEALDTGACVISGYD